MSNMGLDCFGEIMMRKVRDASIRHWDAMFSYKMKGGNAKAIYEKINGMSENDIELLKWLSPRIIDTVIDYFLWTIEQEESLLLLIKDDKNQITNVREESDGLSGELYTDEGWIRRFSKERYEENFKTFFEK